MTTNHDTIEIQVEKETKNEFGYRELTSQLTINDTKSNSSLVIPYEYLINKYRYFLENHIVEKELDEIQYETFRQNPQALSEVLYGTIHLWHSILELNHCVSRIEFNKTKIKYYDPGSIQELINEIKLKDDEINKINAH